METCIPRLPRRAYTTMPSLSAKSVSSLPRPTFRPGATAVPRWRTRIFPARTHCPPNRFTPSRCDAESRPFFELDTPFLCAMLSSFFSFGQADVQDLNPRQGIPVSNLPPVLLATLVRADRDLVPLLMAEHLRQDRGPLDQRRPYMNLIRLRNQEDALEPELGPGRLVHVRQDVFLLRRHP